ncbi:hypothetical protein L1987_51329 [Smallanthus sonchifolius]|uniref:Uncharacterized protein n=1 Tax=Smallanthus sonchifolius TaxID=185202 RepID=A0ACB9EQM1_9ASTR|nr:hypothetical protein L1987_51329 [Smallanthus sonchifolius]
MMYRSQVNTGFWLGLPLQFCKKFLPKEDSTFVLEDENGEQYEVKYIAYKFGISAGWKNFALRHNLVEEDVLVFQLVETAKFKVFILKVNDSRAGHALSLLNSEEQTTSVTPSPKTKSAGSSRSVPHRGTNDIEEGAINWTIGVKLGCLELDPETQKAYSLIQATHGPVYTPEDTRILLCIWIVDWSLN